MVEQIKAMRAKRARGARGFTLIELLVVVVILGVLAAVVVFAVGGISDRGEVSAFSADADTLRTAQEANCAQNGDYVSEPDLVSRGLLASESTLNDLVVSDDPNGCGDKRFAITCDFNEPACGQAGTVPDANFAGAENASPTGVWTRTGDLPEGVALTASNHRNVVTMSNGKALLWGDKPTGVANPQMPNTAAEGDWEVKAFVYDPATRSWSATPPVPPPVPENWNPLGNAVVMLSLEGTPDECGSLCGKVLMKGQVQKSATPGSLNAHFFIFDPAAFDQGANPWTRVADPTTAESGFSIVGGTNLMTQVKCSRAADPGSDCGKVLVAGGSDSYGGPRGYTEPTTTRTALFDPAQGATTPAAWALATPASATMPGSGTPNIVGLPDGRVLYYGQDSWIYDPFTHVWTQHAAPNSPGSFSYTCGTSSTVRFHDGSLEGTPVLLPGTTKVLATGTTSAVSGCGAGNVKNQPSLTPENSMLFDYSSNTWALAPSFCPCQGAPTARALSPAHGGKVLMVYGRAGTNSATTGVAASALFDGSTWTPVASTFPPRTQSSTGGSGTNTGDGPTVTVLASGQVLIAGGTRAAPIFSGLPTTALTDTYLYTPPVPAP